MPFPTPTPLRLVCALMLLGTSLAAREDESSGASAVTRAGPRVVSLPPYVVEEAKVKAPWRYAQAPGLEVISLCSDAVTAQLIAHNDRLRDLLDLIVPRDFQAQTDVPGAFVLYSSQWEPQKSQTALAELTRVATAEAKSRGGAPTEISVEFMPNFQFCDRDSRALFAVIDESSFGSGRVTLSATYVRYLLQSRTPAMPRWLIDGLMELYKVAKLESGPTRDRTVFAGRSLLEPVDDPAVTIDKAVWIDEAWSGLLRKNPKSTVEFIPLAELFQDPAPTYPDPEAPARRRSELALFIRWTLDPATKGNARTALWKFVAAASSRPATEEMFKECFGVSHEIVEQELHDYLRLAVRTPLVLPLRQPSPSSDISCRAATDSEVSRLKGDLQRLEIAYVKDVMPVLTERYTEQALRTLHQAYNHGDRDPRTLAVLGLCEVDAGNDAAARPFLAAAAAGKVVRPRVYYELARIDLTRLSTAHPDAVLSIGPANELLAWLEFARHQSPPLPEIYALMGEVWLRSDASLTPAQLGILDEGLRLYPKWIRLITEAALLHARSGNPAAAQALINRGLDLPNQESEKAGLRRLREALRGGK